MNKIFDALAIGSCYIDTNLTNYPFSDSGITTEVELVGDHYETVPGGSAVNFCLLLQTLGLKTAFVGMVGADSNGDLLASLLDEQGVGAKLVRQPGVFTNISFNMTNPQGKHIMLVAGSANAALSPELAMPKLEEVIPQAKVLYLGGCFKLKTFTRAFVQIVALAKRHETTIVVDHGRIPEGVNDELLKAVKELVLKADYYFPSRGEFCGLWSVSSIEDGLHYLNEQAPQLVVVVKDGENGAYYLVDGKVEHAKAVKIEEVSNVTGAGDSFNAGVIAALNRGAVLPEAVAYGCHVAAARIKAEAPPLLR